MRTFFQPILLKLLTVTVFGSLAVAGSAVALTDGGAGHGRAWIVPADPAVHGQCPYLSAHPSLTDDPAAPDEVAPGDTGCPYLDGDPAADDAAPDDGGQGCPYLQQRPVLQNDGLIA